MDQNLFTITDQDSLNSAIHRSTDDCDGTCEYCKKFYRAQAKVSAAQDKGLTIMLTKNAQPVEFHGHFLAWCNDCSTGENAGFWDACDWGQRHVEHRHSC